VEGVAPEFCGEEDLISWDGGSLNGGADERLCVIAELGIGLIP
jgi:hypothetical protein